jgi:hypothetical protein
VARWLRLRKQVPLLVVSFLLSSIYRTVGRVWFVSSATPEVRGSTHNLKGGLLFVVGRRLNSIGQGRGGQRFALEFNGSFPFLHVQSLAPGLVSVAFLHTPCLSQTARVPKVNGMQFGFGIGPSGNSGACNATPGFGNQFSSNPPIPSPGINIGEPAPTPPGGQPAPGEGACAACGGCGSSSTGAGGGGFCDPSEPRNL